MGSSTINVTADQQARPQDVRESKDLDKKDYLEEEHAQNLELASGNLVYDVDDEEPELHLRTYIAIAAMFLLNLVQVFALQGPPAVVCQHDMIFRDNRN